MPWVRFTGDFDFKPSSQVTIAYPAGQMRLVTTPCADIAVAAAKGEKTTSRRMRPMPDLQRTAGALRERVHFQRRQMADDGMGSTLPSGEFTTRFTVWRSCLPLRGSEAVQASRLEGRQPFIVSVRQSSETRQATESWRLVGARDVSRVFAIVAPATDPDAGGLARLSRGAGSAQL